MMSELLKVYQKTGSGTGTRGYEEFLKQRGTQLGGREKGVGPWATPTGPTHYARRPAQYEPEAMSPDFFVNDMAGGWRD